MQQVRWGEYTKYLGSNQLMGGRASDDGVGMWEVPSAESPMYEFGGSSGGREVCYGCLRKM